MIMSGYYSDNDFERLFLQCNTPADPKNGLYVHTIIILLIKDGYLGQILNYKSIEKRNFLLNYLSNCVECLKYIDEGFVEKDYSYITTKYLLGFYNFNLTSKDIFDNNIFHFICDKSEKTINYILSRLKPTDYLMIMHKNNRGETPIDIARIENIWLLEKAYSSVIFRYLDRIVSSDIAYYILPFLVKSGYKKISSL